MIDSQIVEQLKTVFEKLEGHIELVVDTCSHDKFNELTDMLTRVAKTSEKITVTQSDQKVLAPRFSLKHEGHDTGICF